MGEIAAGGRPVDLTGARDAYERAVALAMELGMSPLAARARLGLAGALSVPLSDDQ